MIYINKFETLTDKHFDLIDKCYKSAEFRDGSSSAYYPDFRKHNIEITGQNSHSSYYKICELLKKCVEADDHFQTYTSMVKTSSFLLSEYKKGMFYKKHSDNAAMRDCRTDWSCTLFLNNSDEYEGGELKIYLNDEKSIDIKLNRGEYVLYPTGYIHEVAEITSGSRRVCVFWIQSSLRDRMMREIHSDLVLLKEHIFKMGEEKIDQKEKIELLNGLVKIRGNILRNYGDFNFRT